MSLYAAALAPARGEHVIELEGRFDGSRAWELRHELEELTHATKTVVIDFSRVAEFHDFGVAVLAQGIADKHMPQVRLVGLRRHHARLFACCGIAADGRAEG